MQISYTNRKGRTYFLCQGSTKTGKLRYYFAREPDASPVSSVPTGYEIKESVNGVVSLTKIQPKLLTDAELESVKGAIQAHPKAKNYRADAKLETITVYEKLGPDLAELMLELAPRFGLGGTLKQDASARMEAQERTHSQFRPIMRFILTDHEQRLFSVERMRFSGGSDYWLPIEYNKSIGVLSAALIPKLGTDGYFELF